jgi:hypothetical protein
MRVAVILLFCLCIAAQTRAEVLPHSDRSYATSWMDGTERYRSVMFPHERGGCKIMIQARYFTKDEDAAFVESEGTDCDCDLLIDGQEKHFQAAKGDSAKRLLAICRSPGVPGDDRRLMIMRESLKEHRNFSRIPNVDGF